MLLGSGNVVHNLPRLHWNEPDSAFDWAERFDEAVLEQLQTDPGSILKVAEHPDYNLAVPTPDHFIPLLYIAGLAAAAGERPRAFVQGYSMGSISMTCYGVDAKLRLQEQPKGRRHSRGAFHPSKPTCRSM